MAQAIIKYDLTDSDDQMEFERANKALDMALVLWEMCYNTKKKIYHKVEYEKIDSPYDAVDKVFEMLWEELEEHGINIDKLIC